MREIAVKAAALNALLARLVQADADAYTLVSAAYKLAKGTPEEVATRDAAIQAALMKAAEVPLETARACAAVAALAAACAELRAGSGGAGGPVRVVSEDARGLHARIKLQTIGALDGAPAFHIQLDYRRPRGDRHRPLSPGAVALLARLSEREREVAMRVREGLRTAEIAAELRRSPLTVKTQLASIFNKLGARGRARVTALLNR